MSLIIARTRRLLGQCECVVDELRPVGGGEDGVVAVEGADERVPVALGVVDAVEAGPVDVRLEPVRVRGELFLYRCLLVKISHLLSPKNSS